MRLLSPQGEGVGGNPGSPGFGAQPRRKRRRRSNVGLRVAFAHRKAGAGPVSNYPKKCWYVAATCDEIAESPLGRRLLGEDVVLWRGASGRVTAFENRCAHRAFPLSHSSVDGDRLVCGYHGCTYNPEGECISVPSQPQVPTRMSVPVFPVLE